MRIKIKGLSEWKDRLARADLNAPLQRILAERAEALAETVRHALSESPGAGSHDTPWAQSGALRDSIAVSAEGLTAAVGSNDPAAAPQEMGTIHLPPRPFLAPAAAEVGPEIAEAAGQAVADALKNGTAEP